MRCLKLNKSALTTSIIALLLHYCKSILCSQVTRLCHNLLDGHCRHQTCIIHHRNYKTKNVFDHLFRMMSPPQSTHAPISKAMATTIKTDNPENNDKHRFSSRTEKRNYKVFNKFNPRYIANNPSTAQHWSNINTSTKPDWRAEALCFQIVRSSIRLSVRPFVHLLPNLWTRHYENERTDFDAN